MALTEQPTTFVDLYTQLLNRARSESSQTITLNNAKSFINTGLFDMHLGNGEKFPWAHQFATLRTKAPYSTGTVSINKGSTSLTGSGTAWNTANDFGENNVIAGGKIKFDTDETIYQVSAVGSDTGITLTFPYRLSDASAIGYQYWEDEYDLDADFLKPIDQNHFDTHQNIALVDRREYERRFTRRTTTGTVIAATIFDRAFSGDTTPVRRIALYRPPDEALYIPYSFVTNKLAVDSSGSRLTQMSSDDDEPILPLYARHLIVLYALHTWYRDKKNDDRAASVRQEYIDGVKRLQQDVEVGQRRPNVGPNVAPYKARSRMPYRSRPTGRYTTGDSFDENR